MNQPAQQITQLKNRYLTYRLIECVLLAVAAALLVWSVSSFFIISFIPTILISLSAGSIVAVADLGPVGGDVPVGAATDGVNLWEEN